MKKLLLLIFAVQLLTSCSCNQERSFAIIVDSQSYEQAKAEVDSYAASIEKYNGMTCYIVEDKWAHADSVRAEIKRLYTEKGIEGVAFVGNIPVAMISNAQHMTTAFKMDQKGDIRAYSVPSDRFYDDLDLEFTFLSQDEEYPYFFYSLNPSSPQKIECEIYSGRIRPMDEDGNIDITALKAYLNKVVAEKESANKLDHTFFFSGHGFISESLLARVDEQEGIYEHFPWLKGQKDRVGYIDHKREDLVKFRLMNELMREELDYAIVHHHGHWDTQYLSGAPEVKSVSMAKEHIANYCRSYVRNAVAKGQNANQVINSLTARLDVPRSWIANYNDPVIAQKDSIASADMDIVLEDFAKYSYMPNVRTLFLDACYCGAFQQKTSIANEYIFNSGKTITCVANSVNVLQDKWSDRYVGLMGLGMPVGQIVKLSPYLEAHVVGDPTFTFVSADADYNVAEMIADSKTNWAKHLNSKYADVQTLAMAMLYKQGELGSDKLLEIYKSSPHNLVRLQALELLSDCRDHNFIECVKLAVNDGYEMTQRFAIKRVRESGDPELVPTLVGVCITNNTSERTDFNAVYAVSVFPQDSLLPAFEKMFASSDVRYINKDSVGEAIRKSIISNSSRWVDEMENIQNPETSERSHMNDIRMMRNNGMHYYFGELMDYFPSLESEALKIAFIEMLGWQTKSFVRADIMQWLQGVQGDANNSQAIRDEALRSYNRLD
ncbi:MAG: HEAT repeat domain-containing protein [Rikenellaceae bacterium]